MADDRSIVPRNVNPNTPPITSGEGEETLHENQPRQPSTLHDVLRYCMEAQGGSVDTHPLPMDEERKHFLQDALQNLTVDVVEELEKSIRILTSVGSLELQDDPKECEEALDLIGSYIDNLDFANDFHKIGGFKVLQLCLNSSHSSIRWKTAEIIADLTQNNPYCQHYVIESGLLPVLLKLVDEDSHNLVRVKSLYAVSCLVRDNEATAKIFKEKNGYSYLLKAMQSGIEKLQIKSVFLLSSLCTQYPQIKDELCDMGFVEQLIGLISTEHQPASEHILSALLSMATDHNRVQSVCKQPEFCLKTTLKQLIENVAEAEEFRDEKEAAMNLLNMLFQTDVEDTEDR